MIIPSTVTTCCGCNLFRNDVLHQRQAGHGTGSTVRLRKHAFYATHCCRFVSVGRNGADELDRLGQKMLSQPEESVGAGSAELAAGAAGAERRCCKPAQPRQNGNQINEETG